MPRTTSRMSRRFRPRRAKPVRPPAAGADRSSPYLSASADPGIHRIPDRITEKVEGEHQAKDQKARETLRPTTDPSLRRRLTPWSPIPVSGGREPKPRKAQDREIEDRPTDIDRGHHQQGWKGIRQDRRETGPHSMFGRMLCDAASTILSSPAVRAPSPRHTLTY